jgi:D-alanyl-D-alanine carboxypeptidase
MLLEPVADHDGTYYYGLELMIVKLRCGITVYGHEGRDLGGFSYNFSSRDGSRQVVLALTAWPDDSPGLENAAYEFRDRALCD